MENNSVSLTITIFFISELKQLVDRYFVLTAQVWDATAESEHKALKVQTLLNFNQQLDTLCVIKLQVKYVLTVFISRYINRFIW
jgi:hypothetical protein